MKNVLINVDYSDHSGKFWADSYLKNKVVSIDETKNIHAQINEILKETDGQELSYKCKPQSNIYVDLKNGTSKKVGYVYRSKTEIYDRSAGINGTKAFFDCWVTLKEIIDFPITEIN